MKKVTPRIVLAGTLTALVLTGLDAPAKPCPAEGCNDGLFCNGTEICVRFFCQTQPFSQPCNTRVEVCNESTRSCEPRCATNADCSDGIFCNGPERCVRQGCRRAAQRPCLSHQTCLEFEQFCSADCAPADRDGDGVDSIECGGADCDDSDPNRFPGNVEVCDAERHDEDCGPETFGRRDADGDGFFDALCCNEREGAPTLCGSDCNDSRRDVYPLAIDVCDGIDNNCNGVIDETTRVYAYPDNDSDGFGDANADPLWICPGTPYFAPLPNDCDDNNAAIVPGALVCDTQGEETVLHCRENGLYKAAKCPAPGDTVCLTLPNGTATCVPRKCIAQ